MRALLTVLILLLTLSASGISSAIASSASGDDCCADGAGEDGDEQRPDGERDKCPPLCHACACSPTFAVPNGMMSDEIARTLDRPVSVDISSQLPASPPGRGVFHPPRHSA